jgi:hypothetical protein
LDVEKRLRNSDHPSAFEAELAAFGILHKLIAPITPDAMAKSRGHIALIENASTTVSNSLA